MHVTDIQLAIPTILLAIAVPSYLSFKDRANKSAAQANVRAAVPAVEAFYADNGTYVGLSNASTNALTSSWVTRPLKPPPFEYDAPDTIDEIPRQWVWPNMRPPAATVRYGTATFELIPSAPMLIVASAWNGSPAWS